MNRTVSTSHAQQTKLRLPKRILLVRHGQSLGNVDEEAYHTIPDWLIPITETGENQARKMGQTVKDLIGNEPIYIYYSPYLRTRQTMVGMMEALSDNPIYGIREEPRITEQQFGNFQNKEMENYKKEKNSFGRFYYRFPDGESGLDVYNRVTSFIGSLFREWYSHTADEEFKETNVIIVTHGLSLRLFIMRWFHFTVHQFEESRNPDNGAIIAMERFTRRSERRERSANITIPKHHNHHDSHNNHSHHKEDNNSNNNSASSSLNSSSQIGLSVSQEEDDYLLDLHPVSSYEKVEMSRFAARNPHHHTHNNHNNHNNHHTRPNTTTPTPSMAIPSGGGGIGNALSESYYNSFYNNSSQWYNSISSNTHFPRRYSSKDNLTLANGTGNPDTGYDHHLEDEDIGPIAAQQAPDEFECFVLTKESQELLQFYIPKKAKRVEHHSKYFKWKEYNQIYKLEEEISADVESLTLCPRRRLARTTTSAINPNHPENNNNNNNNNNSSNNTQKTMNMTNNMNNNNENADQNKAAPSSSGSPGLKKK